MEPQNLILSLGLAKTDKELLEIVNSIPLQENGYRSKFARHLDDCFWYMDLNTFQLKKDWLIKICNFYKNF